MKKRFDEDVVRWEAGELTLGELEARHPGKDARGLAELHGWLATINEAPTPDPGPGWVALRHELPARIPGRVRGRLRLQWRIRRSLVAAVTTALLGGTSVAYAAGVEPVRHEVNKIVKHVVDLFDGAHGDKDDGGQGNTGHQGNSNQGDQGTGTNQGGSNQGDHGNSAANPGGSDQGIDEGNTGTNQGDLNHGDSNEGDSNQGDQGNSGNQGDST